MWGLASGDAAPAIATHRQGRLMSRRKFATPQEAETAFYQAFEGGDLEAMMEVWADDDRIVCIHPGAPRLEGVSEVAESWRQIFANGGELRVDRIDAHCMQDALLAIHQLREVVDFQDGPSGVVLATNIFQLIDGSWRMVLHHASPEPDYGVDDDEDEDADENIPSVMLH